ncbi:MAG: hypothetical protein K6A14_07245 [Erysipelotrichaceae bacterium]|nr:hypothetical protein [Erysipelotrichaceae bacterium]
MELLGAVVLHNEKGRGKVIEQHGNKFVAEFSGGEKMRFLYPKSFESFLKLEDEELDRELSKDLDNHVQAVSSRIEAMNAVKRNEIEERNRLNEKLMGKRKSRTYIKL